MTAERTPQAKESVVAHAMGWLTRLVVRFPVATLALGLALGLVALVLTGTRLGYHTSRLDLLESQEQLQPAVDRVHQGVRRRRRRGRRRRGAGPRAGRAGACRSFRAALAREDRLVPRRAARSRPGQDSLQGPALSVARRAAGHRRFSGRSRPDPGGRLVAAEPRTSWPSGMSARLEAELAAPRRRMTAAGDATSWSGWPAACWPRWPSGGRYQSPWPEMPSSFATLSELNSEYLLTKEGQLGFVLLRLARGDDSFTRCTEATDALRELIAQTAGSASRDQDRPDRPADHGKRRDALQPIVDVLGQPAVDGRRGAVVRGRLRRRPARAAGQSRACWWAWPGRSAT